MRTATSRGLQIGLPLSAIIAATVPVWGMSWYFDTENWAAGIWNSWAEERTDDWREAMVRAVWSPEHIQNPAGVFAVHPPGVVPGGDFSFLVIGDTGEGDASQHSLRAQWLEVVRQEAVKFVVISSDVVYPTGAMRDYEPNFWLPFMGTTKPVYAIPGNHDWYDALEGFNATFLEPEAARAAMRARVAVDGSISSTTDARIEELIRTASRLRSAYRVPTQFQQAPFFQFQTDTFALFAVDTGVARRVDPLQLEWLKAALASAKGKTKMAILGHPLYTGGHYVAADIPDFAAIHALLREHEVAIVMAGDTHDLEFYREPGEGTRPPMLHFVNGGGGAYLSFGTALDWPAEPPTVDWAYYPSKQLVMKKIEATTPTWKWPAWWWTKRWGAWPFSAEWLSAAFDVNVAPYYQSFIEVRVEPSRGRIRFIPYGVHRRLRWSELDASAAVITAEKRQDSLVEWEVKMRP
jgi:3',5'-cyclic AMP phosphodiesterase CpdA